MGMAASQARFLSLTARKTNLEFEGQQINQQRTTLSNESAGYYSKLCNLDVPTPPSTEDYVKTTYSFTDGNETNTITSLIAQANGKYSVSFTQSYLAETMVSNGNVIVTRKKSIGQSDYVYSVGATELRQLGSNVSEGNGYPYNLSEEDKAQVLARELEFMEMLNKKYCQLTENGTYSPENNWYVRYQQNSSSGIYEPVFYSKRQMDNAEYTDNGSSITSVKCYVYGQAMETKEIKNASARLEQDTSGRYINITIYDDETEEIGTTHTLSVTTACDDNAYNDAINEYNYQKTLYDKDIQDINSKIEVIQSQDKDLELRLKQLDTEENAITNELDAVKKVITKNVESSFKTFNA